MADGTTTVPKSVFESKTVWGLVLAVIYPYLVKHGYAGDPAALSTDVITIVGAGMAIWGRFSASQSLTLWKK